MDEDLTKQVQLDTATQRALMKHYSERTPAEERLVELYYEAKDTQRQDFSFWDEQD